MICSVSVSRINNGLVVPLDTVAAKPLPGLCNLGFHLTALALRLTPEYLWTKIFHELLLGLFTRNHEACHTE